MPYQAKSEAAKTFLLSQQQNVTNTMSYNTLRTRNKLTIAGALSSVFKSSVYTTTEIIDVGCMVNDLNTSHPDVENEQDQTLIQSISELKDAVIALIEKTKNDFVVSQCKIQSLKNLLENRDDEGTTSTAGDNQTSQGSIDQRDSTTPVTSVTTAVQPMNNYVGKFSLEKNTPRFKYGINVRNWLMIVKVQLRMSGKPDDEWLPLILTLLEDDNEHKPQQHAINLLSSGNKVPWKIFEELMLRVYEDPDYQRKLKLQLKTIKHGKTSITIFNDQFLLKANQVENISDDDILEYYIDALKPSCRTAVEMQRRLFHQDSMFTINDAMRYATTHELNQEENKTLTVNMMKNHHQNQIKPKNNNGNYKTQSGPVTCHKCGSKSHLANKCVVPTEIAAERKKKLLEKTVVNKTHSINDKKKVGPCNKCNKMGHLQKDCRVKTQQKKPESNALSELNLNNNSSISGVMFNFEATIVGNKIKHNATALVDSGANISTISPNLILDEPYHSTETMIETINGPAKAIGFIDHLEINVHGRVCILPMYIVEQKYDLILGKNWMDTMDAGVQMINGKRCLRFKSEIVFASEDIDNQEESIPEVFLAEIEELDDNSLEWTFPGIETVKPQIELSPEQFNLFNKTIIKETKKVTAKNIKDLGRCDKFEYKIEVTDEKPIYAQPYKLSELETKSLKKEIDELLDAKIIRKSKSAWAARTFLIPKKNTNQKRMVVNYIPLNKISVPQRRSMRRIDDIIDKLARNQIFTDLDLKAGYYQFPMEEKSIKYTAFSTPFGNYEFLVTPFGHTNCPAVFQDWMEEIFEDMQDIVTIYLDNITIHSKTVEEHFEHVQKVLKRLDEYKLKLNLDKCTWLTRKLKVLGKVIENGTINMDPELVEAIINRQAPKNVKQVQQFMGLVNYQRDFLPSLAKISQPLYNLIKSNVPWNCSEECQNAFDKLKVLIASAPCVKPADFNRPFTLHCDASGYALGAVLCQTDDNGNEYMVGAQSRLLKGAELNLSTSEKEALALIFGIKKFRTFLDGVHFKVITDHSALRWLMSIKDPSGRLARWSLYLQQYSFDIIHRKGALHVNADAISRPVIANREILDIEEEEVMESKNILSDPHEDDALKHYLRFKKNLDGISSKQAKRVKKLAPHFMVDGDVLRYRKKKDSQDYKIYPERNDRINIMMAAHGAVGHHAFLSTYNRICEKYYWKDMRSDIIKFVLTVLRV